jgi:hypothetical protein
VNHSIDEDLYEPAEINRWLRDHEGICPHCRLELATLPADTDLGPHVTGICRPLRRDAEAAGLKPK